MGLSTIVLLALKLASLASGLIIPGAKGTKISQLINELGTAAMAEVQREAERQGKTTMQLLREAQDQSLLNEKEAVRILDKFGVTSQQI